MKLSESVDFFKALANRDRLRIVYLLYKRQYLYLSDIVRLTGIVQSQLTRDVKQLHKARVANYFPASNKKYRSLFRIKELVPLFEGIYKYHESEELKDLLAEHDKQFQRGNLDILKDKGLSGYVKIHIKNDLDKI